MLGDLIHAGRINLRSGGVTLALLNGVVLSLEGPADLDLLSLDRVYCRQGRLRARVPRQAEGFVIATPRAAVFDLETEFALNVDPSGRARIKVFEGAAAATLLDDGGDPEQSQIVAPSEVFELDPGTGRIAETHAGAERFAVSTSGPVPPLDLDPSYPGVVRDSRPIAYWRFQTMDHGAFVNEVPGASALLATGAVRCEGDPRGNPYLVLRAADGEPFLETEAVWDLSQSLGHAVEFWFLAEASRHAVLVGLLPPGGLNPEGQRDHYLHNLLVEITAWQRQSLHKPGSVRLLLRSPHDPLQVSNVYSAQGYVAGQWHHVIAQQRGDLGELYLDGNLTQGTLLNPGLIPFPCQLVVGRRMPDAEDQNESRAFAGGLDELALYDHALTSTEIQQHLRAAARKSGR